MKKKITMQSIADDLRISKSLVSRALSNQSGVSEETRECIRLTAIRMGYQINSSLVSVPSSKTGNIAVLLPRQDLSDLEFWGKIISGIEAELRKISFSMILAGIDTSLPADKQMPSCIIDRKTDGAIIMGIVPISYILAVQSTGIPITLIDSMYCRFKIDQVLIENYQGVYDATKFILNKGHQRIGFVGDITYSQSFIERHRGFVDAVSDFRTEFADTKIEEFYITDKKGDSYIPLSTSQLEASLQKKHRPTALVCANDPTAFVVMESMEKMGLSCPQDISLIGFDNVNKCQWVSPALTSIDACKVTMGMRAVQLIIRRLNEPDLRPEHIVITTQIIERSSILIL